MMMMMMTMCWWWRLCHIFLFIFSSIIIIKADNKDDDDNKLQAVTVPFVPPIYIRGPSIEQYIDSILPIDYDRQKRPLNPYTADSEYHNFNDDGCMYD